MLVSRFLPFGGSTGHQSPEGMGIPRHFEQSQAPAYPVFKRVLARQPD